MATPAYRVITRPTFRDIQGRFTAAEEELLDARRDELRREGRFLRREIIERLRVKVDGPSKIERGIRFNTRVRGDTVRLNVTAPGRARPHPIRAVNARALAFFWPRVGMQTFVPRSGGFKTHVRGGALWIGKGQVDHPGGTLVPLLEPILRDVSRDWERTRGRIVLNRISTRYEAKLTR